MENDIEQAKVDIAELIRTEAEKEGIQLTNVRWWSVYPATQWDIEVKASNGRTAFQKFSPKQLVGFQNDGRLRWQVREKVISIIIQLTERHRDER